MNFKLILLFGLVFLSITLKAQEFSYKLNKHAIPADPRYGIQLIHSDSTGYYIYIDGGRLAGKSANVIYKLDKNLNVCERIEIPKLKNCTIQKFFKTTNGIGWFHDYYNPDSSLRFYEVTRLNFNEPITQSIQIGTTKGFQPHLFKKEGCNIGFSTNQCMVYFYLWKEKPGTEKVRIKELTILDMNLNLIIKTSLPNDFEEGSFLNENVILDKDTTIYGIKEILEKDNDGNSFLIRPEIISGHILQSWHVPSGIITNFEVKGINRGINHAKLIYDNTQKLHFAGFYTSAKKNFANGFFDYEITVKKELSLINEQFFTFKELEKLKVKSYNPTIKSGKDYGLKAKYKIEMIRYDPTGYYNYFFESQYFIVQHSTIMPMSGGFIAGAIAGGASALLDEYAANNPTWIYDPLVILRKPINSASYSLSLIPTAQKSQNQNSTGIYQFDFNGSQYIISNESTKNCIKPVSKWEYFLRFTNDGQAIISTPNQDNTLIRYDTHPEIYQEPAIVNVKQIVRLSEKAFFIVVKPSGSSREHYVGLMTIN